MTKFKRFNKFLTVCIICSIFLTPLSAFASSITIDEETFNKLVTRAREAEVFEKEKEFYKQKYEKAIKRSLELNALYKEDTTIKDRIIDRQKELVDANLERIKLKDDIIALQDKKISRLEKSNWFRNILILGISGAGIALASDRHKTGAAVGIGAAGLLTLLIK